MTTSAPGHPTPLPALLPPAPPPPPPLRRDMTGAERAEVLRVHAPGRVELWRGGDHPVEQLVVQRTSRGFWRGARLTLTGVDGSRTVLKVAGPDVNPADLGEPEIATWRAVAGGVAGSIGIVLVPLLVLVLSPLLLVRTLRRRSARDALAAAIDAR